MWTGCSCSLLSLPLSRCAVTVLPCITIHCFLYNKHSSQMTAMMEGIKWNKNTHLDMPSPTLPRQLLNFPSACQLVPHRCNDTTDLMSLCEWMWDTLAYPHLRVVVSSVVQQSKTYVVQPSDFTGVVAETLKHPTANISWIHHATLELHYETVRDQH